LDSMVVHMDLYCVRISLNLIHNITGTSKESGILKIACQLL